MSQKPLYDEWDKPKRPSSAGIPALLDPADREDPDRPLRTEDLIPRHGGNGSPKLWLPDGSKMEYYGRPSGWGGPADDSEMLSEWTTSKVVEGLLDHGRASETLRAERSVLGPRADDKDGHKRLHLKAKNIAFDMDRVGTLVHKMTEKYDLDIPFIPVPEYEPDLGEWARLTRFMEIINLPDGRPGVECFVAMDQQRLDPTTLEPMFDVFGRPLMVRLAGTFDRLVRYIPCPLCGCSNYILDLKTSAPTGLKFAQRKSGIQLGIYSRSELYVPWPDGSGATRYALPDVCQCRGILVSLPAGTGEGSVHWINVHRGFVRAVTLIPQIKDHQKENDWMVEFTPVPNMWAEIDKATSRTEVQALYHQYPGDHWTENDGALAIYASNHINALVTPKEITA